MDILSIDCDFAFNKIMPIINTKAKQHKDFNESMRELDIEIDRNFIFPTSCRVSFIKSILDMNITNDNVFIIKDHEEILRYIDCKNDSVINIDFHDDGVNNPKREIGIVGCGNWCEYVTNCRWVNSVDQSLVKNYDMILICISPEWTPNLNFLLK